MRAKTLTTLAAGLLLVSTGLATAQNDKEQKPEQLRQNQSGTSGTEAGVQKPQPSAPSRQGMSSRSGMATSGRAVMNAPQHHKTTHKRAIAK